MFHKLPLQDDQPYRIGRVGGGAVIGVGRLMEDELIGLPISGDLPAGLRRQREPPAAAGALFTRHLERPIHSDAGGDNSVLVNALLDAQAEEKDEQDDTQNRDENTLPGREFDRHEAEYTR